MSGLFILGLCWTLAASQQFPPFNVDSGAPPAAEPMNNQTLPDAGVQQSNVSQVEPVFGNDIQQGESDLLPNGFPGSQPLGAQPVINDAIAGVQQPQQPQAGGVAAVPGVVPPEGVGQVSVPPQFPAVPGVFGDAQGSAVSTTSVPQTTTGLPYTGPTTTASANATASNSTAVPSQTTTAAGNIWEWWNKLWGSNKKNDNDDYYDDDYYDDDYYDDDYYNGDYNDTANGNATNPFIEWLEGEFTTTTAVSTVSGSTVSGSTTGQTETTVATVTPSPCPLSAVSLGEACKNSDKVAGVEDLKLTLKDVMEVVFDEAVINDLILECNPGQWCLKDARFFNPLKTDTFTFFCNYTDCLADYAAQCNTEERTIVTSSLRALCATSHLNMSDTCSLQTKMLLHVALADQRRAQLRPNTEDTCGMQVQNSETCGNGRPSCLTMAQSFECLADHCLTDEVRPVWANVPYWQWYFWDPDYMRDVCKKGSNATTDCRLILPEPQAQRYVFLVNLDTSDTKMMTGMFAAIVVALAGLVVAVYACVKRFSGGYSRDKVQYAEIRDANFDHV